MMTLRAEALGKAYRVYRRPFDSLKELLLNREYSETFWALRDVTLEVAKGDSLGIIGDNGAGKSTLLKLLAGALRPSVGRVERAGRVAGLLTLGAGFHPDLSGSENIRIGCAVLGLSPAETDGLVPEIVEFSELGSFVDRPVRTYSSGMYLRLGFSVATAVSPEVLVVDEHLSVGDKHFRFKCKRRIMDLRAAGCTIVLCSHDTLAIAEVCERTLWLHEGRPAMLAETQQVLQAYDDHVRLRDAATAGTIRPEHAPAKRERPTDNYLREAVLGGDCRDGEIASGGTLKLRVVVRLTEEAWREGVSVAVVIIRNDGVWCLGASTKLDEVPEAVYPLGDNDYSVTFVIERLPLLAGQFSFLVALQDYRSPHTFDYWPSIAPFSVRYEGKETGLMRIPHRWDRP